MVLIKNYSVQRLVILTHQSAETRNREPSNHEGVLVPTCFSSSRMVRASVYADEITCHGHKIAGVSVHIAEKACL